MNDSLQIDIAERNNKAWVLFNNMIKKDYLDILPNTAVNGNDASFSDVLKNVRVDRITKIIYDKKENNLSKLNNVFSAIYSAGSAVFIILKNSEAITDIFIGVRGENPDDAADSICVLERALCGNFPGISKDDLDVDDIGQVADEIRNEKNHCVACVTGVPSLKNDDTEKFTQGIEKIIDAMGTQNYTALLLATPVSRNSLERIERGYQNIYSDISLLNISQLSLSEQESRAIGKSITKGFSDSISNSVAQTNTITDTQTTSTTITDGTNESRTRNDGTVVAIAASTIGAGIGTAIVPGAGTLIGGAIGGVVGGIGGALLGSKSTGANHSEARANGKALSVASGTTDTETNAHTDEQSNSDSETETTFVGKTYNYEVKNRQVVEIMQILDEQMKRVRDAKNYGAWNWAAYFIARDSRTVKVGADVFSGILKGKNSGLERSAISIWTDDNPNYKHITNYLAKFQHPIFSLTENIKVESTALLNTPELTVGMSLPQKSLPGIPIFSAAPFGRSVSMTRLKTGDQMAVGAISHMGMIDSSNRVLLNLDSLTSHTFITGSTGSGKSNSIYKMLDWIHNRRGDIPFLVIEPAKGEYKNVFGGLKRVNVYGTNPYHTPLLKINPFAFPQEIHVMEHIDRLIEILNAVWPMYAAMPAILKEAVEETYKKCGWDLLQSSNKYMPIVFPDFYDLLTVLPEVISASQYADELKSNYAGALITRVKSLTNGYYKTIFQKDELSATELFDKSCIVDISRVGSAETKSLLMGIVFLKLQEYRMAKAEGSNQALKHITVLEEAHHLLRRTGTEQGMESANLKGKSVEMLTNAIAEMRTYGEGFIIADQSPGLLDPAVIRNTNTKILFRLPDFDDRELVGKSQNLNDAQIEELARLTTGCASVYQNDWQEAVLCQFDAFDSERAHKYQHKGTEKLVCDSRSASEEVFIATIIKGLTKDSDLQCQYKELPVTEKRLLQIYYPAFINECLCGTLDENRLLWYLNELIGLPGIIKSLSNIKDFTTWTSSLIRQVFSDQRLDGFESPQKDLLLQSFFKLLALQDAKQKELWENELIQYTKWRLWK